MGIYIDETSEAFVLSTERTTYAMAVYKERLVHLYYGAAIDGTAAHLLNLKNIGFNPNPAGERDRSFSLTVLPLEYPGAGCGDFRECALYAVQQSGSAALDLRYRGYAILDAKPTLTGLPTARAGADCATLSIHLADDNAGVEVTLLYTVYEQIDIITRSAVVRNASAKPVRLGRAYSACLDLPAGPYDMLSLTGKWAMERQAERAPLRGGMHVLDSKRGASSHQANPFCCFLSPDATETSGDAYGIALLYSGNHAFVAEVPETGCPRILAGINPYDFEWLLEGGDAFTTPEAVLCYHAQGLGGLSHRFHDFFRRHVIPRSPYARPPVLLNSWEASYFAFDEETLLSLARKASGLGINLFVMDDGWFAKRSDDTSSLGDWVVNESKLKGGLSYLAEALRKLGMDFGIWLEPEMVSPDSDLYRDHPDWCIHVPERPPSTSRAQLVLDFSRADVVDHIHERIRAILRSADIKYVKWDMNRHLSEVGSAALPAHRQRETAHRHILGVYRLFDALVHEFPHILFESCSGGGGRFDGGMLCYTPQIWTSDNTDAIDRLKIQYGTSFAYPVCSMGTHVSASPNHSVNRRTDMKTRGDVALFGTFGYELNLHALEDVELSMIRQQIEAFDRYWRIIYEGDYYRLSNPLEDNHCAYMSVTKDKSEAVLCYVQILSEANGMRRIVKLAGLDPDARYRVQGIAYSGRTLMHAGLLMGFAFGDYQSQVYHIQRV